MNDSVIFFIGYPGSGKGTQGKLLAKELDIIHLSTGELFRNEVKNNSIIGNKMNEYMSKGLIIPKELTFIYLKNELSLSKYRKGFILDGYPKNIECFHFIMNTLKELEYNILATFYFHIDRNTVTNRLMNRLYCDTCERNYNKYNINPIVNNKCDKCCNELKHRNDDSIESINKRLDIYEHNTLPILHLFNNIITLDANKNVMELYNNIINHIKSLNLSSIYHNHIDAKSIDILKDIINNIKYNNKIYPVRDLCLGKQYNDLSIYNNLPNFHTIENSNTEAFATGKMGNYGFNYDQILQTLDICKRYPNMGVMTELEEEIYAKKFTKNNVMIITLDRGNTPYTIDWNKLVGWKDKLALDIPKFELHHGFDIDKQYSIDPPIDIKLLMKITQDNGFNIGGWFIFHKHDRWAYRSNEFSNMDYNICKDIIDNQTLILRDIIKSMIDYPFTNTCSIEKVHAIWKF